jgi:hypothetical protein
MAADEYGIQEPYATEDILIRVAGLRNALFAAGTYKKGQLLGCVTATGSFTVYDSAGSDGSEVIAGVCPRDITIDSTVKRGTVMVGEFSRAGVTRVMAALSPAVTVNDALVGACFKAGVILN